MRIYAAVSEEQFNNVMKLDAALDEMLEEYDLIGMKADEQYLLIVEFDPDDHDIVCKAFYLVYGVPRMIKNLGESEGE